MTVRFYRPRRKDDLVRHMEAEHGARPFNVRHWTVAALTEEHDGLHAARGQDRESYTDTQDRESYTADSDA